MMKDIDPLTEGQWQCYSSDHEVHKYCKRIANFLIPQLRRIGCKKVLEVGCGSGIGPIYLREHGFDAWGIDPFFRDGVGEDYEFLIRGEGKSIPFKNRFFDATYSLEVIEHVGTTDGCLKLAPNYQSEREAFVEEICRVTAKHVVITTPNKYFPIDEHGKIRHGQYGFRFHSPFEKAMLSVRELELMFSQGGFVLDSNLDPRDYYQLERIRQKFGAFGVTFSRILLKLSSNRYVARTVLSPHLFLLFRRDNC